jgi:hypothetical protein
MLNNGVNKCPENAWPPKMGNHLVEIVAGCSGVVEQIDVYLTDHMAQSNGQYPTRTMLTDFVADWRRTRCL